jgi:predicted RNase H-like HicB family nuclease
MRFYSFEVVIEKEAEDSGYFAWSPNLPGCFGQGGTIEEAKRNMREAVTQHIEALQARGEVIPQNERLVHVEELAIGLPTCFACSRLRRATWFDSSRPKVSSKIGKAAAISLFGTLRPVRW